jgi:penicillin amidase
MDSSVIIAVLSVMLLLALATTGVFLYVYWWQLQRPNPKLEGKLHAPFLSAPVEVVRDKHGVPHVYAQNEADLWRAQGWLHAQDRMWQMEQARRIASGRLAELFGAPALDADRFCRIIGFRRAAEAELAALDGATQQVLEWYAGGVNGYIETHRGRLAAEINLLRVQVEPWTPLDTVACAKAAAWAGSINWESELTRLRLLQELDPYTAAELDPDYPQKNPIVLEGVGSETKERLLYTAGLLLDQYERVRAWLGEAKAQGSNSWVVAPRHSLNRRALLCADPHLGVQLPGPVYEMHLSCPELELSGATYPGQPAIGMGHNALIAWGTANALVDTQDLLIERPHPDDPARFAYGDAWEQAQVVEEVIAVRRGSPHTEQVVITRNGPLVTGFLRTGTAAERPPRDRSGTPTERPPRDRSGTPAERSPRGRVAPEQGIVVPLALRWSGHAPGRTHAAQLALARAGDWQAFNAALADWAAPALAFTYADARGNIGFTLAGRIPQRGPNLGLLPGAGFDPAQAWGPPIPHGELPHLYNPPSGKIVVANNKPAGDDYAHFLGVEFDPGWRAARIEELLAEKDRHTIRDMEEMQQDTYSKYAQALTPWLTLLRSEDPWEKTALQLLRKWNFRMETDSPAALCFHYILAHLMQLVWGDKLGSAYEGYLGVAATPLFPLHGFRLRAETRLLELLNGFEESFWYADVGGSRQRQRDELLQEALTRAMKSVRQVHGDSSLRWAWGRTHQVRFAHPLGRARLVGHFFDRGPLPIGGDATTPLQTRTDARPATRLPPGLVTTIPVYRQIYEVGAWDRAESVLAGGQSGHPLSRLYDDQVMMWREGVYHTMPWTPDAVDKVAAYRLTLHPGA